MNNYVKIFDLDRSTSQAEKTFDSSNFKGNVTSIGFRNHDRIIYTSCEDGYLKIFDLRGKNLKKEMKQSRPINCAVIHPNDK